MLYDVLKEIFDFVDTADDKILLVFVFNYIIREQSASFFIQWAGYDILNRFLLDEFVVCLILMQYWMSKSGKSWCKMHLYISSKRRRKAHVRSLVIGEVITYSNWFHWNQAKRENIQIIYLKDSVLGNRVKNDHSPYWKYFTSH